MKAVEAEPTMRLAAPAELREPARPTLVELLRRVDGRAYTVLLAERGLLTLLGSRAIELAPGGRGRRGRSVVESARPEARLRALVLDTTLRRVVSVPEDAGVPTLPIKGTTLADRVHGDPGLRPTTDVDVLVCRAQIPSAVGALRALGYAAPEDPVWADGLPEMHYTFGAGVVTGRGALHALGTVVKRSPRMVQAARRSPERPTLLGDFPTEPGSDASGPTHVSAPRGPPP